MKFSQSVQNNKCPNSSIYIVYIEKYTYRRIAVCFLLYICVYVNSGRTTVFFWSQHLFAFNHPLFYDNICLCTLQKGFPISLCTM